MTELSEEANKHVVTHALHQHPIGPTAKSELFPLIMPYAGYSCDGCGKGGSPKTGHRCVFGCSGGAIDGCSCRKPLIAEGGNCGDTWASRFLRIFFAKPAVAGNAMGMTGVCPGV